MAHQPVSVAIEADQTSFQLYVGGVYDDVECGTTLDHGVLVVGYGVEPGAGTYWIVKVGLRCVRLPLPRTEERTYSTRMLLVMSRCWADTVQGAQHGSTAHHDIQAIELTILRTVLR